MEVEPAATPSAAYYVLEMDGDQNHPFLIMQRAVRGGDAAQVHKLLCLAGLPRIERPLPPTLAPLIFEACRSGSVDCVELLLERDACLVNATDLHMATPLHLAAMRGDTGIANALLSRGASIVAPSREGFQPLHAAANLGRRAMVDLLLSRGAPVDSPVGDGAGATALILACEGGHIHCAELLLNRQAQVNTVDTLGTTPLLAALAGGHEQLAELLLASGASGTARPGPGGRTPLHYAAYWGFVRVAQRLLEQLDAAAGAPKADVDVEDAVRETPLLLAARRGFSPIVDMLLSAGAAVDHANVEGITPLMAAAFFDHEAACRALLSRGASVAMQDAAQRRSAMHLAALGDAAHAAALLLQHGASSGEPLDKLGATPLQLAIEADAQAVLPLLQRATAALLS